MNLEEIIEKAFQCKGWFNIDAMIWALINDDHEEIARFRLMRRKLESKKRTVYEKLDDANSDAEREAILAAIKAPMDAKEIFKEELEKEKRAIKAQRKKAAK